MVVILHYKIVPQAHSEGQPGGKVDKGAFPSHTDDDLLLQTTVYLQSILQVSIHLNFQTPSYLLIPLKDKETQAQKGNG